MVGVGGNKGRMRMERESTVEMSSDDGESIPTRCGMG